MKKLERLFGTTEKMNFKRVKADGGFISLSIIRLLQAVLYLDSIKLLKHSILFFIFKSLFSQIIHGNNMQLKSI